jgi:gamma-glutamylcyclotransferase (GGCT)/AIG2-like uncharacterized protein YtfP
MPSREPIHLFVYGTLTDPERVVSLTGRSFAGVQATLKGFARVESPLGYPFIFPRPGAVVHGLLLQHVDPDSLRHLDAYEAEGELYRRQMVEVEVAGTHLSAMTYIGFDLRALFTGSSAQDSSPGSPSQGHEATIPARHLATPCVDEH